MSYIDDYLPVLQGFEGKCAWMYQDSKGNVTAACGLMLATATAAQALPFMSPDNLRAATASEIGSDWMRVRQSTTGFVAGYYKWAFSPLLSDAVMTELLRSKVMQFDVDLQHRFPKYGTYPDGVKMALLDMEYNLGDERERAEYVHFNAAVLMRDWRTAAAECGRNTSDPAFAKRNAWTKFQFVDALGSGA